MVLWLWNDCTKHPKNAKLASHHNFNNFQDGLCCQDGLGGEGSYGGQDDQGDKGG